MPFHRPVPHGAWSGHQASIATISSSGTKREEAPSYARPMNFHELTMESITGESIDFSSYAGQHCLIVNVASR